MKDAERLAQTLATEQPMTSQSLVDGSIPSPANPAYDAYLLEPLDVKLQEKDCNLQRMIELGSRGDDGRASGLLLQGHQRGRASLLQSITPCLPPKPWIPA